VARLDATIQRIVEALAMLAGAIFAAMTLAIPVDVGLRACCRSAIFGLTDLTEHGLAAATFLAAPWVLVRNAHVSVDIMIMLLSSVSRRRVEAAVSILGTLISAIFAWYAFQAFMVALSRGSMVRGIIVFPEWLTFVAPVLSGILLAFCFLLRIGQPKSAPSARGL
jgi:TRAP-type C4-dicarboxylate transport system permease small subunit